MPEFCCHLFSSQVSHGQSGVFKDRVERFVRGKHKRMFANRKNGNKRNKAFKKIVHVGTFTEQKVQSVQMMMPHNLFLSLFSLSLCECVRESILDIGLDFNPSRSWLSRPFQGLLVGMNT